MIDEVLQKAYDDMQHNFLWLADNYDTLVDIFETNSAGYDRRQVDQQWLSPFIGKGKQDAAEFVKAAPKPPKALNKLHFVVLDKEQYEKENLLTVCKIIDVDVQSLACVSEMISVFLIGHDRDEWEDQVCFWQEEGLPTMT